jgi:hypothetical protein
MAQTVETLLILDKSLLLLILILKNFFLLKPQLYELTLFYKQQMHLGRSPILLYSLIFVFTISIRPTASPNMVRGSVIP